MLYIILGISLHVIQIVANGIFETSVFYFILELSTFIIRIKKATNYKK